VQGNANHHDFFTGPVIRSNAAPPGLSFDVPFRLRAPTCAIGRATRQPPASIRDNSGPASDQQILIHHQQLSPLDQLAAQAEVRLYVDQISVLRI
jgi:hypothetical protein